MGNETIRTVLRNMGLTEKEVEVYIFLSRRGVLRSLEIARGLKTYRTEVYRVLQSLKAKGLISITLEAPMRFKATPFNEILDLFIKTRREEVTKIEDSKPELLNDWEDFNREIPEPEVETFSVIEGRKIQYKISQMIKDTKRNFYAIIPSEYLKGAENIGILQFTPVEARMLIESNSKNLNILENIGTQLEQLGFCIRVINPDLGLQISPQMVIKDNKEILFFTTPGYDSKEVEHQICLWTNCRELVKPFLGIFDELWRNSISIQDKIDARNQPETRTVKNSKLAEEKYNEAINSARSEILIVTSSEGLVQLSQDKVLMKKAVSRGVLIRVMAPITCKNLESAMKLIGICEVKNGPPGWLITTIIDNKILFQSKTSTNGEIEKKHALFYTTDPTYVETTINIINKLWKNARVPSYMTLKSILDNTNNYEMTYREKLLGEVVYEAPPEKIKETDILNKIFAGKKYPTPKSLNDIIKYYGSSAIGIVYPPKYFDLPELLFNVLKCNKQSSFGVEDWIIVSLKTETKNGSKYMPVVYVTDNPEAAKFRTKFFTKSSRSNSVQFLKEHELQVHVQGNSLFAGWTTPIALPILGSSIPPAALLFEGFGNIISGAVTRINQLGRRQEVEFNRMEARFTFFHPSSNYSGPGIDGFFDREMIFTSYPKNKSIN